jgi:hypothetical protein
VARSPEQRAKNERMGRRNHYAINRTTTMQHVAKPDQTSSCSISSNSPTNPSSLRDELANAAEQITTRLSRWRDRLIQRTSERASSM